MSLLILSLRNLIAHPIRTVLTMVSLTFAIFLLANLRSIVTALELGTEGAKSNRLMVQSAVSLYVDLPLSYQGKIEAVEGVKETGKWQWFGGYYQDPKNFFAQFAVDPAEILSMYPECVVAEGSQEAFLANRQGCMVGRALAKEFGWKLGERVPIVGALFPHPDGAKVAWEFDIEAIYEPTVATFDERTLFFQWDYFLETMQQGDTPAPGVGVIALEIEPGSDPTAIMAAVDALFENGPQRVQTTTESEFQSQFISMLGSVPTFLSTIGGGILFAILLACVNTMLMAGREQTHDAGILMALGFTGWAVARVLLVQSLLLCGVGGTLGVLCAKALEPGLRESPIRAMFPGFAILPQTVWLALGLSLAVGLVAGILPALRASRLQCVEALGARE